MNKTTGERECNWGSAVNVKDRYIYVTQPTEYRIIVIDLRLREIIEVRDEEGGGSRKRGYLKIIINIVWIKEMKLKSY